MATNLMRMEAARQAVQDLPISPNLPAASAEALEADCLSDWLASPESQALPCPLRAGIAQHRLLAHPDKTKPQKLAMWILHQGGYDLKGFYSLDEQEIPAQADLTKWLEHFCESLAATFENARQQAQETSDFSTAIRKLDPRQRKGLELFRHSDRITSHDVERHFGISQRTARDILSAWVDDGFVLVMDAAKKSRKYGLETEFWTLLA